MNKQLIDLANKMFRLEGFMVQEKHRDKPAVTVTFPDQEQANQFHEALVELSRYRDVIVTETESVTILQQILDFPIVKISEDHAGAENGKTLIRAKAAARKAINAIETEREELRQALEKDSLRNITNLAAVNEIIQRWLNGYVYNEDNDEDVALSKRV